MIVEGKSFVVTSGLGSIGGATARLIVEKGGYAIVLDVPPKDVGEKVISTWSNAERFTYHQADIASQEEVTAAVEAGMKVVPKGSLFGAVNCAGANPPKPYTNKMSDKIKDFETTLRVNTYGTFLVDAVVADAINSQYPPLEAFAERVQDERGCIINIASVVAFDTPGRCLSYGPSKTCVLGITNAAADFLAPCAIRVNSVSPAVVFSAMLDKGGRKQYFVEELEQQSMFPRRFTEPPEIAHAIVFLIENPMMNAFHLKVDAGWRMITPWTPGADPRKRSPIVE